MYYFYLVIFILLGLAVGSFLNVLIYRLPKDISLTKKKRSFCSSCKKTLKPQNLIPIFSYLFQKGKCSFCKKKISWQYPLVEFFTMVLFALVFVNNFEMVMTWQQYLKMFSELIFVSGLMVIFMIDLKEMLILDVVIYPLLPIVFLCNLAINNFSLKSALSLLIAGLAGFVFYWLQYRLSRGKWVGAGDQKLGLLLGLMLGGVGLFMTILFAYVGGSLVAIYLLITKKMTMKSQLPMAAFLAPAAVVVVLFGTRILQWYFDSFIF